MAGSNAEMNVDSVTVRVELGDFVWTVAQVFDGDPSRPAGAHVVGVFDMKNRMNLPNERWRRMLDNPERRAAWKAACDAALLRGVTILSTSLFQDGEREGDEEGA